MKIAIVKKKSVSYWSRNAEGIIKNFDPSEIKQIKAYGVRKKPIPKIRGGID